MAGGIKVVGGISQMQLCCFARMAVGINDVGFPRGRSVGNEHLGVEAQTIQAGTVFTGTREVRIPRYSCIVDNILRVGTQISAESYIGLPH